MRRVSEACGRRVAIIRLLEREDPEMASGLSKVLSHANGEEKKA